MFVHVHSILKGIGQVLEIFILKTNLIMNITVFLLNIIEFLIYT